MALVPTPTAAEQHVAGQEALTSLIPQLLRQAWPLLDVHDLQGTLPRFIAAVKAIVGRHGQASAAAALDYYHAERRAAGVTGRVSIPLAPSPADDVIESAVQWATSDLYGTVTPEVEQAAQEKVAAAAERLVLNQSRDTIVGAVHADAKARGWARVPNAGACSFCLMLATRGAVYKSRDTATKTSKGRDSYHDNCRCHVEPLFADHYEPTAQVREAEALWRTSTKGLSQADARKAFRRAVEGRSDDPTRAQKPRT